eukprot:11829571-Prorocentrum_lima.AAC.1
MADRFPDVLHDEIKKAHQQFYLSAQKLEPEDLFGTLPVTVPMAHLYEEGGNKMYGIARYPIDKWMAAVQPVITTKNWVKLCMKIVSRDLDNL